MAQLQTAVHPASDGIRKFIRSLGLNMQAFQLRQLSDESDLIDALHSIKYFFHSYVKMHEVMSPKTKGNPLAKVMEDTQKDTEEYLLRGIDKQQDTLKWFRNAPMYVLVIEPTLMMLKELTLDTLQQADLIVDEVINMIQDADMYGDHDDAVVAREQIRHIIARYRELHPTVAREKRPTKSKKKYSFMDYSERDEGLPDGYGTDEGVESLNFN